MKKILFLSVALLGAVCVEIYSSRQELKFDEGEKPSPRNETRPPGSGEYCWYFDGASGCTKFSKNNCAAIIGDDCYGTSVSPPEAN